MIKTDIINTTIANLDKHTQTKFKPKPTCKFKNCSYAYANHCVQLLYTVQQIHLHTIITVQVLSIGGEGEQWFSHKQQYVQTDTKTETYPAKVLGDDRQFQTYNKGIRKHDMSVIMWDKLSFVSD